MRRAIGGSADFVEILYPSWPQGLAVFRPLDGCAFARANVYASGKCGELARRGDTMTSEERKPIIQSTGRPNNRRGHLGKIHKMRKIRRTRNPQAGTECGQSEVDISRPPAIREIRVIPACRQAGVDSKPRSPCYTKVCGFRPRSQWFPTAPNGSERFRTVPFGSVSFRFVPDGSVPFLPGACLAYGQVVAWFVGRAELGSFGAGAGWAAGRTSLLTRAPAAGTITDGTSLSP